MIIGDIGGTKTFLNSISPKIFCKKINSKYESFYQVLREFIEKNNIKTNTLVLGIAGIVKNNYSKITNLNWEICKKKIYTDFNIKNIHILNDVELGSYFIKEEIKKTDFSLISIGTGLGASICKNNNIFSTETGHSPISALSLKKLNYNYLDSNKNNFSCETFLSGKGITKIYYHITKKDLTIHDIYDLALKSDINALKSITLFFDILAIETQSIVLKTMVTSVYITGGVIVKILQFLNKDRFISIFTKNDKMNNFLKLININFLDEEQIVIKGGMNYAKLYCK